MSGRPAWDPTAPGVVRLPSGRTVRGRSLRAPAPAGLAPHLGVYLLGGPPAPVAWESRWVRWPDFRLPRDRAVARDERVEVACRGGRGRTGTALACLAVLDGVPGAEAVAWVREHYDPRAVETPWQARWVRGFG